MSDLTAYAVAGIILFGYGVILILKRLTPKKKGFPTCFECGKVGVRVPLGKDKLPDEIEYQLQKIGLSAEKVVTKFMCPKGCTFMWYMPRLGTMDRGMLKSRKR